MLFCSVLIDEIRCSNKPKAFRIFKGEQAKRTRGRVFKHMHIFAKRTSNWSLYFFFSKCILYVIRTQFIFRIETTSAKNLQTANTDAKCHGSFFLFTKPYKSTQWKINNIRLSNEWMDEQKMFARNVFNMHTWLVSVFSQMERNSFVCIDTFANESSDLINKIKKKKEQQKNM